MKTNLGVSWLLCAWILWQETVIPIKHDKTPSQAFTKAEDCYQEIQNTVEKTKDKVIGSSKSHVLVGFSLGGQPVAMHYQCLPDTVDPRETHDPKK